jgi:hypothetical protein
MRTERFQYNFASELTAIKISGMKQKKMREIV